MIRTDGSTRENSHRKFRNPAVLRPREPPVLAGCPAPKLPRVAKYFDVHPDNPQPRAISQVVALVRDDGLIAYPTDSCFALGSAASTSGTTSP